MTNICIIGWYGTETLGDRAILDGIITIFSAKYTNIYIHIGSLFPFFTERTIYEDNHLWNTHGSIVEASVFDVYNSSVLHSRIIKSDYLIMGGGPIMDLTELYIIKHAFKFANRKHIPTVLMGCGYGPLHNKEYIRCVKSIIKESDLIIMRSENCKRKIELLKDNNGRSDNIFFSVDPAAISAVNFSVNLQQNNCNNIDFGHWIINIRDLDYVYSTKNSYYKVIAEIIDDISNKVPYLDFIPNHTFVVGGDDRYISNHISMVLNRDNLHVLQIPLSLEQTYQAIISAEGCIGMRYHSILFQTYLNGNNYIIDYTDKEDGKIISFLRSFDKDNFYSDRYINVSLYNCDCQYKLNIDHQNRTKFLYDKCSILKCIDDYNLFLDRIR